MTANCWESRPFGWMQVFKGTLDGKDVAVKQAGAFPKAKRALLQEMSMLHLCAHPNVVRLEGATEDNRCMVLELCNGTVEELLAGVRLKRSKSRGKSLRQAMPVRRIIQVSLEMMRAMEYIHGKGWCHGDTKPANMLLAGKAISAKAAGLKLADFGFARKIGDEVSDEDGGSAPFIPRELQLGLEKRVLANQDVYGCGVVILDLVCTKKPYEDLTVREFEEALEEGTLYSRGTVPLAQFRNSAAADALVDLVFEMVSADPQARPTAAQAVVRLESLAAALDDSKEAARTGRGASSPVSCVSSPVFSPASAMLSAAADDEAVSSPLGICFAPALSAAAATASSSIDAATHWSAAADADSSAPLWQDEPAPEPPREPVATSEVEPVQESPVLIPAPSVVSSVVAPSVADGAEGPGCPGRTGIAEGEDQLAAQGSDMHTAPVLQPPMSLASLSVSPALVAVPDCAAAEETGWSWASLASTVSGVLLPGGYAGCCALWRSCSGPGRQASDGVGAAQSGPEDWCSHNGISDVLAVTPRLAGASDALRSPVKQGAEGADAKRSTW